jgi:hypothetical protein
MGIYRHTGQSPGHLVRHGPWHLIKHARHIRHGHTRTIVETEVIRRRRLVTAAYFVAVIVVAVIVMIGFTYGPLNAARHNLNSAKAIISQDIGNKALLTTSSGRAELESDLGQVSRDAALANSELTSSESFKILGALPLIHAQRVGVIQLSGDLEQAVQVANNMLHSLTNLVDHSHGTHVSLAALASLQHNVISGHRTMAPLDRSSSGLWGPIATARTTFDREDAKVVRLLSLSAKTIAFARPFLGSAGPQTYLIAGMNNAEMRDSGSVLSLDLLTASGGTFNIEHDSSYATYALSKPAPVTLPTGTQQVFGAYGPTQNWPNTDATADFALSGESMQGMYKAATGQTVDGVIGIDLPGVASILALTGPVSVPGIDQPVDAKNVGDLLLNKEYQGLTVHNSQIERRDKIAATVKAAVNKMKQEHVDIDRFANALSSDVQGRHLMVWSDDPTTERGLGTLDAAGTLTAFNAARTFHLAVENSTADKLDYFVRVGVTMHITLDTQGNAIINTTVLVHNGALAEQAPSYQYGPDGVNSFSPGQYVARVFLWGPMGSTMPGFVDESGLQLVQTHFSLLAQQQDSTSFATVIPHAVVNGRFKLELIPQARLVPDDLTVDVSAPGWSVSGPTHLTTKWGKNLGLSWGVKH